MPDGSYRDDVASARRQARLRLAQMRQERLHRRRAARFGGGEADAAAAAPPEEAGRGTEPVFEHSAPEPAAGIDLPAADPTPAGDEIAPSVPAGDDLTVAPEQPIEDPATSGQVEEAPGPIFEHAAPDPGGEQAPPATDLTLGEAVSEQFSEAEAAADVAPPVLAEGPGDTANDEFPATNPVASGDVPPERAEPETPAPSAEEPAESTPVAAPPEPADHEAPASEPPAPAQQAEPRANSGDLYTLPGAGVGLVWMFNQCGVQTLEDLAQADPVELSKDLGMIGQLIRLDSFIEYARTSTGLGSSNH